MRRRESLVTALFSVLLLFSFASNCFSMGSSGGNKSKDSDIQKVEKLEQEIKENQEKAKRLEGALADVPVGVAAKENDQTENANKEALDSEKSADYSFAISSGGISNDAGCCYTSIKNDGDLFIIACNDNLEQVRYLKAPRVSIDFAGRQIEVKTYESYPALPLSYDGFLVVFSGGSPRAQPAIEEVELWPEGGMVLVPTSTLYNIISIKAFIRDACGNVFYGPEKTYRFK